MDWKTIGLIMKNYNRKILLSVTGMSPAVVTETLYALVTEKGFIPTEIQVITTSNTTWHTRWTKRKQRCIARIYRRLWRAIWFFFYSL